MSGCQMLADADLLPKFLESVDNFVFDCDGVLWHDHTVIPGAVETLNKLRKLGKNIFFVTNNSTKSRAEYLKKCRGLGFEAEEEEIVCVAYVTAQYLKHVLDFKGKVYLIGMQGLKQELDDAGIKSIGHGPDPVTGILKDWMNTELDPEVNCVVTGFDDQLSFFKLLKAASYLNREGCLFIATNEDQKLPTPSEIVIPGTGCFVNAVKTVAGREPVVMGKPHSHIFEVLQKLHNIDPSRSVMVGDRLNTDIRLAHNCGMKSLLVLSGIATLEEAKKKQQSNSIDDQKQVPDYYLNKIGDLEPLLV